MTDQSRRNFGYLVRIGAAVTDSHVRTPSGLHSTMSFTKYKLFPNVRASRHVAADIARRFRGAGVEAVVGLANGGAIFSVLVAQELERVLGRPILSFYVERTGKRSYKLRDKNNRELIRNRKVLIVDDTVKTGSTVRLLMRTVRRLGAKTVGIGVVCSRRSRIGIPNFYSFAAYADEKNSYKPTKCPLCKKGVPFDKRFGVGT